jgi:hypothetical protein
MNSSIAASTIAARRSAVRSARLEAGGAGETTVGALARAALLRGRSLASFRVDGALCFVMIHI